MNQLSAVEASVARYVTIDNGHVEIYDTHLLCRDNQDGSASGIHHILKVTIKLDHKNICPVTALNKSNLTSMCLWLRTQKKFQ
jgi:hypothetical protein